MISHFIRAQNMMERVKWDKNENNNIPLILEKHRIGKSDKMVRVSKVTVKDFIFLCYVAIKSFQNDKNVRFTQD